MATKPNSRVYCSRGQCFQLGPVIGRGGEGSVFETLGNAEFVAKVYKEPVDKEKAAKLQCMVSLRTDRLARLTAWPMDTLHDTPGGPITGFIMPRVTGFHDIHKLYSPKNRRDIFPEANWKFLIHTANNLARVFKVVHEHGHVIADVNHGNALVSPTGLIRLIDCDSFQISSNGQRYLCGVGMSTHTPPELQNRAFRGVVRTENHDAFGLAVIIFQLLFMGRHPFAGTFLGSGEMPLEQAILEHRFAYGNQARARQMMPPPATLSLQSVSSAVSTLFERAFLKIDGRPKPHEWITALSELINNTKQCKRNNGHYFLESLSSCPWCEIETKTGILLFQVVAVRGANAQMTFNLTRVWAQITDVKSPGPSPALPLSSTSNIKPSEKAVRCRLNRAIRVCSGFGIMALGIASIFAIHIDGGVAVWIIVVAAALAWNVGNSGVVRSKREFESAKQEAERHWRELQQRWNSDASDAAFTRKLQELETIKAQYLELPVKRQRLLQQLESQRRSRQLDKYLDQFQIVHATIKGIGQGRKTTLESYGIETAADIKEQDVLTIPGFGPTYTSNLMAWRRSIEQGFVFNPNLGVDPADIARVDSELAVSRSRMEQELLNGPPQLQQINAQIMAQRSALSGVIEHALRTLKQAEADLRALNPFSHT